MTIAAQSQLALPMGDDTDPGSGLRGWAGLPEQARAAVLVLLARMIARGVLMCDTPCEPADGQVRGG